jgi:hypothetical protein
MTSTRTSPSLALTATVTISPGLREPLCRTLLPNSSLTPQHGAIPVGVPRAEHADRERTGDPRPFWPTGNRHALPDRRRTTVSAPPPGPPSSRKSHGPSGHTGMQTRPGCAHQARSVPPGPARPWPSVESPTVCTDRPAGTDAVRYASVDTATHRLTVTHRDTRRDKNKTAPRPHIRSQGAILAGGGRCWVRTNVG